ncbi:MAG: BatD family protein [Bacteroidales bacterium]|jgi:hypothetical protein|nr:BatD family protein [Bacteroidales bacterium]
MKILLVILAFILAPLTVVSQEVTVDVNAPQSAVAGQQFRIVYTVNSTDGRFQPPAFDPSFSVSGPQTSSSRNVQWINGEVTSVATTTLVYYVIASMPGSYIIPPARYESKKATVSSAPVEIEITDAGTAPSGNDTQAGQPPENGSEVSMRLTLSTREVYIGQPVTATLKLFTRINLSGINDLKYPDFKGFLREDIETPPLRNLEAEVIDGVQYGTGVLQRFVLYPQIAGELRIDPVGITALVQQRTTGGDPFFNDPFFDNFFSNVTTVPRSVSTQPAVIRVKPLPMPQPSDFHGAVGAFEIVSDLSKTDITVNDALTYSVTLKGKGNLNLAGAPVINFPQGIEKYDPKVTVKSSGTTTGSKVFEYLLIPRNTGTFDLPPVSYTVFDPELEKYITLRTPGYSIEVTGNEGVTEEAAQPAYIPGEEVKYLGQDIRFIRTGDSRLRVMPETLVEKSYYWLLFAMALLLAASLMLLRREQIRRNADITGIRNRRAARNAKKRLAKAYDLLKSSRPELVMAELSAALWGYLGDKLSIPRADLTREKCYAALRARNTGEDLITELDLILSASEYSRYSPTSQGDSPAELHRRTADLIEKLDALLN